MFIAGACTTANQNQVSKLVGNEFVRMNNLPQGIHHAICGSFNQTGIVCGTNNCYSVSLDGSTGTLALTTYAHGYGGVVGFQNQAVIFGGSGSDNYFTEQYNAETNSWKVVNSENAFEGNYYRFSAVASKIAIYSFGGTNNENKIFIMSDNFVWTEHPQTLKTGRNSHKAMMNGNSIYFLQSFQNFFKEICFSCLEDQAKHQLKFFA